MPMLCDCRLDLTKIRNSEASAAESANHKMRSSAAVTTRWFW